MELAVHFKKNKVIFFLLGLFLLLGFNAISEVIGVTEFSVNFGGEQLSFLYTVSGFVYLFSCLIITYLLTRISCFSLAFYLFFLFSALMAFNGFICWAVKADSSMKFLGYSFLFVSTRVMSELSASVMWLLPATVLTTQKAKKFFVYIAISYRVGILLANSLLVYFAHEISPASFMFLCTFTTMLGAMMLGVFDHRSWGISSPESKETTSLTEFFNYLKNSHFWFVIMAIQVLIMFAYYSLDYSFNVVAEDNFNESTDLISYYGLYGMFETVFSILVAYFAFNFILTKFGIWNAFSLIPAAFGVLFALYFFGGKNIFLNSVIGILGNSINDFGQLLMIIIFKACLDKYRNLILSVSDNLFYFFGASLAGLAGLFLQYELMSFSIYTLMLAFATFGIAFLTWHTREYYTLALSKGLFSLKEVWDYEIEHVKTPLIQKSLFKLTQIEDSHSKILGLQIPVIVDNPFVVQFFIKTIQTLDHEDPDFRLNALMSCLRFANVGEALEPFVAKKLNDTDPQVRLMALYVLAECSVKHLERYKNVIEELKNSKSMTIRHKMAFALGALKSEEYLPLLHSFYLDTHPKVRFAAIHAIAKILAKQPEKLVSTLFPYLNEKDPKVAQEIIRVLENYEPHIDRGNIDLLTNDLFLWRNQINLLLLIGTTENNEALNQSAILNLIKLYEYTLSIEMLKKLGSDEPVKLIIEYLEEQNKIILETAIHVVFFDLYDEETPKLIYHDLLENHGESKGNTIEMIEHLGDPSLVKMLNPFLHASKLEFVDTAAAIITADEPFWSLNYVIKGLLKENTDWIRACLVYTMKRLKDSEFIDDLWDLAENDPSEIVRINAEYAAEAIANGEQNRINERRFDRELVLIDNIIFLKRNNLFQKISLLDYLKVIKYIEVREYDASNVIASPENPLEGIYIVIKGEAATYEGGESLFATHFPKDAIGILEYYIPKRRERTVIAATLLKTFFIHKDHFAKIEEYYPQVKEGAVIELCRCVAQYERFKTIL